MLSLVAEGSSYEADCYFLMAFCAVGEICSTLVVGYLNPLPDT